MMHGYMAFDGDGKLLVPFRTWRNTITEEASEKLTEEFHYHIPQRWSIAHLYQAILNGEEHVKDRTIATACPVGVVTKSMASYTFFNSSSSTTIPNTVPY